MEDNNPNEATVNLWVKEGVQASFKIMRRNDVKVRETKNDQRLYYFDEDVDIVVVTGLKSHIEPGHLHTENTEIYFVIQGTMILNVEGEAIWLKEGDLVTVKPGTCHHFETFDEKVIFLAMKKEPGLDDKKLCDNAAR